MSNNGRDITAEVRNALVRRIGMDRFDLWFGQAAVLQCSAAQLRVMVADEFQLEQIRRRFTSELEVAFRSVMFVSPQIDFVVDQALSALSEQPVSAASASAIPPAAAKLAPSYKSRRSPDSHVPQPTTTTVAEVVWLPFAVGAENRVAYTSAESILEYPGRTSPFYLYGPSGCGKTHLLQTIRQRARNGGKIRRLLSVSAEQFTTQFLDALQGSGLPNFRRKFRDVDLLLIDDVHFFAGKRSTIGELHSTMETLLRERKQLVLAADRPPAELSGIGQELRSRMSGGLVCHLPHPELATRRQILELLAQQRGGAIPADVLDLLAQQLVGDARQLSGAINRLLAWHQAHDAPLNLATAEVALSDLFQAARPIVRLADIEHAVCEVFGLEKAELNSERKEKLVSQPRMLAMWLARKHTRAALSEIGRYFGRRSHSTVVSAERNVNRWVSGNTPIRLAHGQCSIEDAIRRVETRLRTG